MITAARTTASMSGNMALAASTYSGIGYKHSYLREDAQSSFRAGEEPGEVVPGRRLHRHPTDFHHRAVGQHDLQVEDLIPLAP